MNKTGAGRVPTSELATIENFSLDRYIAQNPDIARYVQGGGDATRHFQEMGINERRHQLTAMAFEALVSVDLRRYAFFEPVLDAASGSGGEFRFAKGPQSFPLLYGSSTYDIGAYDRESANAGFGPFVIEVRDNPDKRYADIGCGRRMAKQDNCLYVEVYPSVSADLIVEPGSRYPIATGSLDGIGCFAVLEHVEKPWEVVEEFRRMLKPGGKVFIDWPFLQPVHGYPSHFYNATRAGLERMFRDGFEIDVLDTMGNQTPDFAIDWFLRAMLEDLEKTDPATRDMLMELPLKRLIAERPGETFWKGVVDRMSPEMRMTLACGNTLIGRRK